MVRRDVRGRFAGPEISPERTALLAEVREVAQERGAVWYCRAL